MLATPVYSWYCTAPAKALLDKAPELKSYARIYVDGTELDLPETTDVYANIQYISLSEDEASFTQLVSKAKTSGCNYVVISTGNDLQNSVYARSVSAIFGSGDMIAYIQNKKPQEVIESKAGLYAFGFQRDKAYLAQLEAIAYNLHYSYMKAANDRASNRQIEATFSEPYNYASNLEAAIHIREKLECCVLQNGTKYTNDYWMQFGQDMIEYIQGGIDANEVLARMDGYRAEAAATVGDENWK